MTASRSASGAGASAAARETITIAGPGALASFAPDPAEPEVVVRGLVRERGGQRLVSLFLVNGQFSDGGRSVPRWLCQASLTVEHPAGEPVFVRRTIDAIGARAGGRSRRAGWARDALPRHRRAGGRAWRRRAGDARAGPAGSRACGSRRRRCRRRRCRAPTRPGPTISTEPAISEPFTAALPALDMKTLSEAGDARAAGAALAAGGRVLGVDRRAGATDRRAGSAPRGPRARRPVSTSRQARVTLGRIRAGIARARGSRCRRGVPVRQPRDVAAASPHARWRGPPTRRARSSCTPPSRRPTSRATGRGGPFQLAFVLLNLPALADPAHPERAGAEALGRPAVLPDRRRQDRGVPRADRVRDRDPPPAGRSSAAARAATASRC